MVKNSPANARNVRDASLISGRSPREGNGNPLHYSCLENPSHGQRNLAGYSAWGHKESDTTERLSTHTNDVCIYIYVYIMWKY